MSAGSAPHALADELPGNLEGFGTLRTAGGDMRRHGTNLTPLLVGKQGVLHFGGARPALRGVAGERPLDNGGKAAREARAAVFERYWPTREHHSGSALSGTKLV